MDTQTHTPPDASPDADKEKGPVLAWEAPTTPDHDRSKRWYLIACAVLLVLVGHSIWAGSWSFTIVLVLMAAVYAIVHNKNAVPKRMEFWETGFHFDGRYTAWDQCNGYWMLQAPDYIELHIEKKTGKPRETVIQTGPVSAQEIRLVLQGVLPEFSERTERPIDTLIRILKI